MRWTLILCVLLVPLALGCGSSEPSMPDTVPPTPGAPPGKMEPQKAPDMDSKKGQLGS